MGAQSTADAVQSDVANVRAGGLPWGALSAGGQLLGTAPGLVGIPNVPKYTTAAQLSPYLDKVLSGNDKLRNILRLDQVVPTGEYVAPSRVMAGAPILGKYGQMATEVMDQMAQPDSNVKALKQFKPATGTLEDMIGRYAKADQGIGGRGRLIPALKDNGEIFAGPVGGQHPWDIYQQTMINRG